MTGVEKLVGQIETEMEVFKTEAPKTTNKSAAVRARKATLNLEKLMKEYRKVSIK